MTNAIASIKLEGYPETIRRLRLLPALIGKRCLMKAARAGGAPLVKAAKKNWPVLTGISKRALDQKVKTYQDGAVVMTIVGQAGAVRNRKKLRKGRGGISGRGDIVPVHFVEQGTKPHRIPKEGRGMLLLRMPGGRKVLVDHVMHPGSRGRHPIRQAAASASVAAGVAFADKLAAEVSREADALRTA